ncbi:MAG: SGNH hydrolase domain-containing protein, partial [Planctomycetota bacterium]
GMPVTNVQLIYTASQIPALEYEPAFDIMIWGDSHAWGVASAFQQLPDAETKRVACFSQGGTIPLRNVQTRGMDCRVANAWNDRTLEYIHSKPPRCVVLVGYWNVYVEGGVDGSAAYELCDTRTSLPFPQTPPERLLQRKLRQLIEDIEATGSQVVVMHQWPEVEYDPIIGGVGAVVRQGRLPMGNKREWSEKRQAKSRAAVHAAATTDTILVDPLPQCVTPDGKRIRVYESGESLYRDRHHLSARGIQLLLSDSVRQIMDLEGENESSDIDPLQ